MNIHFPPSVALELTYRCNHKCKFCSCPWYAPQLKYPIHQELSIEEWKKVVDILYNNGVEMFSLSGGEILLKEGFTELIRYIREQGNKRQIHRPIVVISNGLLMKKEYLEFFKEQDVHLSMSLPGYETFEYHTGVDNADGVLHWFNEAKSVGLSATLNVTVTNKNIHELFETVSLGLINGAHDVLLNRFLPGGRGLSYMNELKLTPRQVNEMLETTEEVLEYSNKYGNVGTEIPLCAIKNKPKYKRINIGYQCAAAKGFFVVDPSGQIRTCNHSPHIVGHIFNDPIVTDTTYWNTFAHSDYKPQMCGDCQNVSICDCGCREVANILYGSPKAADSSIINQ